MDSSDLQKTLGLELFQRLYTPEALLRCGKIWVSAFSCKHFSHVLHRERGALDCQHADKN